jgi:hypothetical protein
MLICDMEIGPERRRGERSGDDCVEASGDGGALAGQFGTDKMAAQFCEYPMVAAEDAEKHARLDDGVNFAVHCHDERRFSAAVWPQNGNMLAGAN